GLARRRPEFARFSGDHSVHRRQVLCGLAEESGTARGRAALPYRHHLLSEVEFASREGGTAVLVVNGLVKRFGGFTAVNDVSFKVDQGEILGLIGPNGSGKSTIFNMLSGTFPPSAGSIRFEGEEIAGLAPHRIINRGIGRTFQIPRPFRRLTIFENVELAGFYGQGSHSRAKADEAAEKALAMVGLPTDRRAPVDGLGAAGLKKLELAKALATSPKLLLADESLG